MTGIVSCVSNSTGSKAVSLPEVLCNELECLAGKLSSPLWRCLPESQKEERVSLKEIRLTHSKFLICVCLILIFAYVLEVTY